MKRRQFVIAGLATTVCFGALATPLKKEQQKWMVRIKGWLCPGCGRKLKNKLTELPGVVEAAVNVKSGDVKVITADKRVGEKTIRETIEKTNFKVVSIKGPVRIKRWYAYPIVGATVFWTGLKTALPIPSVDLWHVITAANAPVANRSQGHPNGRSQRP